MQLWTVKHVVIRLISAAEEFSVYRYWLFKFLLLGGLCAGAFFIPIEFSICELKLFYSVLYYLNLYVIVLDEIDLLNLIYIFMVLC